MAQCICFENIQPVVFKPSSVYGFTSSIARVLCNKVKKGKVSHIERQITLQIFPWDRMKIAILKCICSFELK